MCLSCHQNNKLCAHQHPERPNVPFFHINLQETRFPWCSFPITCIIQCKHWFMYIIHYPLCSIARNTHLILVNNNHCFWFCHLILVMANHSNDQHCVIIRVSWNTNIDDIIHSCVRTICRPISIQFDCCQELLAIQRFQSSNYCIRIIPMYHYHMHSRVSRLWFWTWSIPGSHISIVKENSSKISDTISTITAICHQSRTSVGSCWHSKCCIGR